LIKPEDHYQIIRYLKSPIIDLGGGAPASGKALKAQQYHLQAFKDKSLETVCVDGIREPEAFLPLWGLLNDGGCLISAHPLDDDTLKIARKNTRFQVIERAPYLVMKKLAGGNGEVPYTKPTPAPGQKTVCLVRYGAYGDHIQMSAVIDHYYRDGWWVVYNCNRKGRDVYRGDPRIGEYIDHEDNIVPAEHAMLDAYWNALAKHYDKFINFAEIAEKSLLRIEGRQPEYNDPWVKRHAECNRNYYDDHFIRCGLPEIKGRRPSIWLSEKEKEWAQREVAEARRKTGKSFIVLWNIMGSSFHKMYPWAYDVWLLCENNGDDIGFVTVSDAFGAYLEEKRFRNILPRSGKYTIRQTLALHSAVDAVVSTETNSMNAGLGFPAPVIALLSHSGKEQFPWRPRDIPMTPSVKEVPCYPCHQLHYSRAGCKQGPYHTGATACMEGIAPGDLYQNLLKVRHEHDALTA
jgi:hypothetical protein